MTDKPSMNDLIRAAARGSSADPSLVERVRERLAPPAVPSPVDGQGFTDALRRLSSGSGSFQEALARQRETSPTIRHVDGQEMPGRRGDERRSYGEEMALSRMLTEKGFREE